MAGKLSRSAIEEYRANGVVLIEQAVDAEWVDRLLAVVDAQLCNPGRWANDANPGATTDRLFTDRYLWRDNDEIRAFVFESGVAGLAGELMDSSTARLYFDHLLVKEPGTAAATPWHQDVPYWPFKGRQICSVWVALTDATVEQSAMEFVRGSHADGRYYRPEVFGERENHPSDWQRDGSGEPVPAIEGHRDDYDIVGWDVKAGDAVAFSAWILHGAPGNRSQYHRRAAISTRWLGDDAVWYPHPGADPTVTQADVSVRPGESVCDDRVFPMAWRVGG